jgi:hypothetical protein
MIFATKKTVSNKPAAQAERRDDGHAGRSYIEQSPCMVMPAVDLSKLIPARFCAPRTIVDYLT